ncbi:hypothetical protein [Massilibacteroides vaginae]|uniref:hypothetical protein n=1 Tax=Massilibacteroides vaginae TaxID=1673718 RepID=UPI000A1C907C|nr:hypothetical protein [Massilibacteroides vaginae]
MRTSNKVILALVLVTGVIYLFLFLNYNPEYSRSATRAISDQFRVVSIEDERIGKDEIFFDVAETKEEAFIYYAKGEYTKGVWLRHSGDTLIVRRPHEIEQKMSLHLHLKGVDKVTLGNQVIYTR